MRSLALLLVPALAAPLMTAASEMWRNLPLLPEGRAAFGLAIDSSGRPVVAGGSLIRDEERRLSDDLLRLNPRTRRWERIGKLDTGRAYFGYASDADALYLVGGVTPTGPEDAVLRVDLNTGETSRLGRLPEARSHAGAACQDGSLWTLGGLRRQGDLTSATASFCVMDLETGKLAILPPPPAEGLVNPALVSDGERIWVFPGSIWSADRSRLESPGVVWCFEPLYSVWRSYPLPEAVPRGVGAVGVGCNMVLLAGGVRNSREGSRIVADTWLFDTSKERMQRGPELPQPLLAFGLAASAGQIILAGGEPAPAQRSANVFTRMLPFFPAPH